MEVDGGVVPTWRTSTSASCWPYQALWPLVLASSSPKRFVGVDWLHNERVRLSQGLNDAAQQDDNAVAASDGLTYLRNPIWWAGISTCAYCFGMHRELTSPPQVIIGEGMQSHRVERTLTGHSRELCRVYVRSSDIGYATWRVERVGWVRGLLGCL